jgi:hypothetical protein
MSRGGFHSNHIEKLDNPEHRQALLPEENLKLLDVTSPNDNGICRLTRDYSRSPHRRSVYLVLDG